jgi:hypothetical protein
VLNVDILLKFFLQFPALTHALKSTENEQEKEED